MASQYKKMNIKNIGIDPLSPVVVSINKEHGAVLYKWYNNIVVFHLKSKTNIKNINALIGKQKIKNREKAICIHVQYLVKSSSNGNLIW